MAILRENASLERFIFATIFLHGMLSHEEQTKHLATQIESFIDRLTTLETEIRKARIRQIMSYIAVIFADRRLDNGVRDVAALAEQADRDRLGSQAVAALFSKGGYSGLIRPSGRMVVKEIAGIRKLYFDLRDLAKKDERFATAEQTLENLCVAAEELVGKLTEADQGVLTLQRDSKTERQNWRTTAFQIEADLLRMFPGQRALVRAFFDMPEHLTHEGEQTPETNDPPPSSPSVPPSSTPPEG